MQFQILNQDLLVDTKSTLNPILSIFDPEIHYQHQRNDSSHKVHIRNFSVGVELRLKVMALLATTNHFSASSGFFSELSTTTKLSTQMCWDAKKKQILLHAGCMHKIALRKIESTFCHNGMTLLNAHCSSNLFHQQCCQLKQNVWPSNQRYIQFDNQIKLWLFKILKDYLGLMMIHKLYWFLGRKVGNTEKNDFYFKVSNYQTFYGRGFSVMFQ